MDIYMQILTFENHEFEGLNNAYLFAEDGDVTLVDTGINRPDVSNQLASGLADYGWDFRDVDQIVLTHWHPDHTGLAGNIQAESNAVVYVHEADASLVRQADSAHDELLKLQYDCFEEWGMPSAEQDALQPHLAMDEITGQSPTVQTFTEGDHIDAGEVKFEVMAAPGHTAGLSCFVFEGEVGQEAIVGDAILPKYTPNVGGADVRVNRPLAKYLDTLESIIDRDFARAWPGHRDVIDAPSDRAQTILYHHRDRAQRVMDILTEIEPADAWTVSAHLFGNLEHSLSL